VEGNERGFDLDDVSPAHQARRLVRPLLLAHGTADDTVPYDQYRRMKVALEKAEKNFETLVIEDEGHSFSKAESEQAWYDALEAFLAKHNPAD
jgi:dipeptidyl aminopeptidase/acylaminoacyl peptidase